MPSSIVTTGLRDHAQVHQEGALLDVGEVQLHHVVERRVAAPGHLPVAGEAGLDRQAAHGARVVLGHLGGQGRAGAHAGELAREAVEELRELVDGVLADEAADARDARVVLDLEQRAVGLVELGQVRQALVGVGAHGAELVHVEGAHLACAPDAPDALLGVDREAGALDADGGAERDRGDDQHRYRGEREGDVEGALHEAVAQAPVGALGGAEGALGLARELGGEEGDVGCLEFIRVYITALIRLWGRRGILLGLPC